MKKKILVWETLSTVSGGQKMTLMVMDLLRDTYDFFCLIPEKGRLSEELEARGIPYELLGSTSMPTGIKGKSVVFKYAAMSLRCVRCSLMAIKKFDPDILYCPGPAALPWSAVCGILKKRPVVWHLHHIFLDGMTGKLLNMCSKWKSVRKIFGVSAACTDQIKNTAAHEKTVVLYNPIDVERCRSGDASRVLCELSEKLGREIIPGKTAVIGHIALVQRLKKQDMTVRICGELKRRGMDVVCLLCGEIREDDFYDELISLAKAEGVEGDVLFLGWRDDIPDIIKCLSLNFCPSNEGFSLVSQEAAAAGVPSLVVNESGVGEFMRLSGAGMTFEADCVDSAVENAVAVINNREEYGRRGMKYSENWRIERYSERLHTEFADTEKFIR